MRREAKPPVESLALADPMTRRDLLARALGRAPASRADESREDQSRGEASRPAPEGHFPGPDHADYRLVHRITYGFTEDEAERYRRLGFRGYLEYHLNHEVIPDEYIHYRLTEFPTLAAQGNQFANHDWWTCVHETVQAHVVRAIYSRRQLYERMVEFWTDHFNVFVPKIGKLNTIYQRDVIRPHALGKFPDLLNAVARSSGMLEYLDNTSNITGYPNENYARELLELHTMGVDGGYPEDDVLDVARCFTGWNYHWDENHPQYGQFRFVPQWHDNARKFFLGIEIPSNGGIRDGERILEILLGLPQTANLLSRKLIRHFLTYNPPEALVNHVANVYLATQGDIKAMLRAILTEKNFQRHYQPKLKRPFPFMVSGLRATRAQVPFVFSLWWDYMDTSGQVPFFWPAPNGYQDRAEIWVGNLQPRWRHAQNLAQNYVWQVTYDLFGLLRGRTREAVIRRFDQLFFGGTMPAGEREQLRAFLSPNPSNSQIRDALGLVLAGPGFQMY